MLLSRADSRVGTGKSPQPLEQPAVGRSGVCVPGGHAEPPVSAAALLSAIRAEEVESLRPLLPVGYAAGAEAYRAAALGLTAEDLSTHYTGGLDWFRAEFVPYLKGV